VDVDGDVDVDSTFDVVVVVAGGSSPHATTTATIAIHARITGIA
jgi:hypothetical protein